MPNSRMLSRKLSRVRMERGGCMGVIRTRCVFISLSVSFWWLFFVFHFVSESHSPQDSDQQVSLPLLAWQQKVTLRSSFITTPKKLSSKDAVSLVETENEGQDSESRCAGKYVYIHDLPGEFNTKILEDCGHLNLWNDMCATLANAGLGQPMTDESGIMGKGWYATDQFALEIIFHERLIRYDCLTTIPSQATALFVPFYAGLEIMQHLWDPTNVSMAANITVRDSASLALASWLEKRPEWLRHRGKDHFMVGGRITWDFRRQTDRMTDWGNKLLLLPPLLNMSTLVIEASPWHPNDFAIPYPTYFHPSTDLEVQLWQERVRTLQRRSLFCFAGAPRPEIRDSIRGLIISQCDKSEHCKLLKCGKSHGKCHSPSFVMQLFLESTFCLQPEGDSFTRRSIFDSMLAGCIPVFFNTYSAYTQYVWHLPSNHSTYSVFISQDDLKDKNVSIQDVLLRIPSDEVLRMQKAVINLIPSIVYSDPRDQVRSTRDAFDLALDAVLDRFSKLEAKEEEASKFDSELHMKADEPEHVDLGPNAKGSDTSSLSR